MKRVMAVAVLLLAGGAALFSFWKTSPKQNNLEFKLTNVGQTSVNVSWSVPQNLVTNPSSVDFGTITIGQISPSVLITFQTTSGIAFTSFTLTGANASEFIYVNNCPVVLQANQSCTGTAKFKPITSGIKSAQLLIGFAGLPPNAPGNLQIIVAQANLSKT
jgi:hypothetical protein